MKVRFVVLEPESKRGSYEVPLPIVIGRGSEAKFRIQQDRISRKHCELFDRDGDVYVRDLGSTNGTFLDGEQIASSLRTPVPPGSVLRVGTIEIRIDYTGSGRLAAAASTATVHEDATIGFTPAEDDEPVVSGALDDGTLERSEEAVEVEEVAEAIEDAEPAEPREAVSVEEDRPPLDGMAFMETQKAPDANDLAELEAAEPVIEAFTGEGLGAAEPAVDGSFEFLGDQPAAEAADDDQLGEFFKGLN